MTTLLSQNNARGSGEPTVRPTFLTYFVSANSLFRIRSILQKSPRRLSGRYLHMIWTASVTTRKGGDDETLPDINSHDERTDGRYADSFTFIFIRHQRSLHYSTRCAQPVPEEAGKIDSGTGGHRVHSKSSIVADHRLVGKTGVAVDAEPTLQDSRSAASSITSGVSAALLTLAKHCPTQLGWKTKSKRRYGALEAEDPPKTSKRHRQLIGLGRPRQEEVLLTWLTHPMVPSDVHGESTEVVQNPCDSEVATAQQESSSHISIKRRKTAHRVSLTSIPEVDEGWSAWLTRPLRTPGTLETSSTPETTSTACGGDASRCTSLTSYLSRSLTTSATVAPVSSAYASCFASPHRPPSVIHWKFS